MFKPQTKEMLEVGAHQTAGVDMFVTPERLVLLDTQVRVYFLDPGMKGPFIPSVSVNAATTL